MRGREPRTDTGWGRGKGHSMSETTAQAGTTPSGEGASENPAMEGSQPRTFTQEEVNEMVGSARKKERQKFANYDEYRAASEQLPELQRKAEESEAQLAEANARIAEFEQQRQIAEWAEQAARETGVPASVLKGSTLDELQAHAQQIKAAMPVYPTLPADGGEANPPAITKEEIYKIKNREERVMAMGQHPELFE